MGRVSANETERTSASRRLYWITYLLSISSEQASRPRRVLDELGQATDSGRCARAARRITATSAAIEGRLARSGLRSGCFLSSCCQLRGKLRILGPHASHK